MVGGFITE